LRETKDFRRCVPKVCRQVRHLTMEVPKDDEVTPMFAGVICAAIVGRSGFPGLALVKGQRRSRLLTNFGAAGEGEIPHNHRVGIGRGLAFPDMKGRRYDSDSD